MAKVKITGHASGSGVFTITAPNSNTNRTITLPDASVTLGTDATKLPLAGGTMTGAITTNSTFDGVDVAAASVLASAALPKGGGTMSGEIVLNSTNLTCGDSTSNANKIRMGASDDLNIHHDGSNSYIEDSGTGSLRILGSSIELRNAPSDNELMLKATTDGSVELYHNNVKKIETTATGVTVTGAIAGATNLGKITKVTMAYNSSTRSAFGYSRDLFARNNEMVGHKIGFSFVKASASTDIMVVFCMQVAAMRDCYQCATYSGTNYSSTFFKRFAFSGSVSIGNNSVTTGMTITGTAIYTAAELDSTGTKQFYWAMGRLNDGNNSSYVLNPDTNDHANYGGATTSTITVYEGDFT